MQELLATCFIFVLIFDVSAQAVEWVNAPLDQVIQRAKVEEKIVFVDIYTIWCGPCIRMDKSVFPESMVGSFFNEHFLSIKLNAEDGGEGSHIAQKYEVNAYPTLLFLDGDGALITSVVGMKNKYELVELARQTLALSQHDDLLNKIKSEINKKYTKAELKQILKISQISKFVGKQKLVMRYLDMIDQITEEDLRLVMGEIGRIDLTYLQRLSHITTSLSYSEMYRRRNGQEWINWKIQTEKSVFDHLTRHKENNDLAAYEETLEILKNFVGIKSRQIDNRYLDFYRRNDIDQYRSFAMYYIDKYIIPTRPEEVKKADEAKYAILRKEILKDMSTSLGSEETANLYTKGQSQTPTIDSLSQIYTISKSIADQLYEISGDFYALYDDDSSRRKASFWASLAHLYYPYAWKYFDNHIYILEAIGKPSEASRISKEAQSLPWYKELMKVQSSF